MAGLLTVCPWLQILATSRERLGVPGELLFAVPEARLAEVTAALGEQGGATVVGRVIGQRAGGRVDLLHAGRVVEPGRPGYVAF